MKDSILYLGFVPGENFGWGICSRYLIRELSKKVRTSLVLNQANQQRYFPSKLIQSLVNQHLDGLLKARGEENYGYVFFENELTERSIENSKKYDLIIAGSTWGRDKLKEKGILNSEVLVQGIDPELFYPIKEEKGGDSFIIFSGGKFEFRKGQDIILAALKIIQAKYRDVLLMNAWWNYLPETMATMAGSPYIKYETKGAGWPEMMNHIYRLNGLDPGRIITCPVIPHGNLRQLFKQTDIGIFPNRCEGGTNLALMEYMACGKPVIAANATGHKDIVNENNALLLNNLGDIFLDDEKGRTVAAWKEPDLEEVVSKIEYAYHNREKIREIGKNGARDLKEYTWEKSADRLLSLVCENTGKR